MTTTEELVVQILEYFVTTPPKEDSDLNDLFEILDADPTYTELDLGEGLCFSLETITLLLTRLTKNNTIERVRLTYSHLFDTFIPILISFLQENKTVKILNLSNNHLAFLNKEMQSDFLKALEENKNIQYIDFSENLIEDNDFINQYKNILTKHDHEPPTKKQKLTIKIVNSTVGLFTSPEHTNAQEKLEAVLKDTSLISGESTNRGDCFFDSFRQSYEYTTGKQLTVKNLRSLCSEYVNKLDTETKGKNWISQYFSTEPRSIEQATFLYERYKSHVQYTAEDFEEKI